jgi:hypothetical protein
MALSPCCVCCMLVEVAGGVGEVVVWLFTEAESELLVRKSPGKRKYIIADDFEVPLALWTNWNWKYSDKERPKAYMGESWPWIAWVLKIFTQRIREIRQLLVVHRWLYTLIAIAWYQAPRHNALGIYLEVRICQRHWTYVSTNFCAQRLRIVTDSTRVLCAISRRNKSEQIYQPTMYMHRWFAKRPEKNKPLCWIQNRLYIVRCTRCGLVVCLTALVVSWPLVTALGQP